MVGDTRASPNSRKRVFSLLKIAVSIGFLALLLSRADLGQVAERLRGMDISLFLGALALFIAGVVVRAWRWAVLLWSLGVRVAFRRLVSLDFVGAFFNLVLPTGLGGDAVKALELSRDSGASPAISSVLVERATGLLVLFALATATLAGSYRLVPPAICVAILAITLAGIIIVVLLVQRTWLGRFGRRLGAHRLLDRFRILRELYSSLHVYSRKALVLTTAGSLLFNLMQILANFLLAEAVGIHLPVWIFFLFVPIVSATLLLPSVGGLGLREGAYVFLFGQVGIDHDHALALALSRDLTLLVVGLIGVAIYVIQNVSENRRQ